MTALPSPYQAVEPDRRDLLLITSGVGFSILVYPLLLNAFHFSVGNDSSVALPISSIVASAILMTFMFAVPALCLYGAIGLASRPVRSVAHRKVLRLCYLGVIAPTAYVFMGVLLYMSGGPISDELAWLIIWLVIVALVVLPDKRKLVENSESRPIVRLRVGHGIASTLILVYVSFHLFNHLMGIFSPDYHAGIMEIGRSVYRNPVVEPALVALVLGQIVSGLILAWHWSSRQTEPFRVFQLMSGVYLSVFILGHMNSVFFYARSFLGIETDWAFATGSPSGLLFDPWNIRLVPHYGLGAFLVLSHAVSGLRVVLHAHNVDSNTVQKVWYSGLALSGIFTSFILLAMCGLRVDHLM